MRRNAVRFKTPSAIVTKSGIAAAFFMLASSATFAQTVNLTAAPTQAVLADGSTVPMWGLSCTPSTATPVVPCASGATVAAANPNAGANWSPVVITVAPGPLTINLTNNLSFPGGNVPTSLVVVGQLGGGLGLSDPTTHGPLNVDPSPAHAPIGVTWSTIGDTSGATFTPPAQGPRVRSFGTEVNAGPGVTSANTTKLTWTNLKPGTYLLESGTHPSIQGPMGLYGIVVVTTAPVAPNASSNPAVLGAAGTAYPGKTYSADVALILSEVDAAQNAAVSAAVNTAGFQETSTRQERDSVSSVTLVPDPITGNPQGGSGYKIGDPILISSGGITGTTCSPTQCPATNVTVSAVCDLTNPTTCNPNDTVAGAITAINVGNVGAGYSSIPTAIVTAPSTGTGAVLQVNLTLAGQMCSNGAAACYPPAVNFSPRYFLVNGAMFDPTNPSVTVFSASSGTTDPIVVRLVNAGLRQHVPSIVGAQTLSSTAAVVPGMTLLAEDGNLVPGLPRIQNEVFMAAGKTYDILVNAPAATATLPIFDRSLSLSGNNARNGGMEAYIGSTTATPPATIKAQANPDSYYLVPGQQLVISDPAKGVVSNDIGVHGVAVSANPAGAGSTLSFNADGTFTYTPGSTVTSDQFSYCANGAAPGTAGLCTTVKLIACTSGCLGGAPLVNGDTFSSKVATSLQVAPPGILANDSDPSGLPLSVDPTSIPAASTVGLTTLTVNADGSIEATAPHAGNFTFTYSVKNSQGTSSTTGSASNAGVATVSLIFQPGSGLVVNVYDAPTWSQAQAGTAGATAVKLNDYRWIIEEDRTMPINPAGQVNTGNGAAVLNVGTNFHTSYMPVVASGCTGQFSCEGGQAVGGVPSVCDLGNGVCRPGAMQTPTDPSQVALDPTKRYYISILPGDAANPFTNGGGNAVNGQQFSIALNCASGPGGADFQPPSGKCGHGMGGANIGAGQSTVNVLLQQTPFAPTKIAVFAFEDDQPLNGEHDAGGGVDVLSPNEPGLGGFEVTLFDDAGSTADATGQLTHDMFNLPLSNSLAGTIDPVTGFDACPISKSSSDGIVGRIVTCPKYESDGKTLSPYAGSAIIANMMPGRYGVVVTPGADALARGENWIQTNTLDGQKAHDSFVKIGGPGYFQEFGPASFHVMVGFANPTLINARHAGECPAGIGQAPCNNTITGRVTGLRLSRSPDERLYSSGSRDSFAFTQCYVSMGDPDAADFQFVNCNADGTFTLTGVPDGQWRLTIIDRWNDQIVDGLSTPAAVKGGNTLPLGDIATTQWHTNIYSRTYIDTQGTGVSDPMNDPGIPFAATNNRFRDGSMSNLNTTDPNGYAAFNEIFPLFNWYILDGYTTRYKQTGVHVVYDAGGPADSPLDPNATGPSGGKCTSTGGGKSAIAACFANSNETVSLPTALRFPGSIYCSDADCSANNLKSGTGSATPSYQMGTDANGKPVVVSSSGLSTGRIDPPWVTTEAWQGYVGQAEFVEFGKTPFAANENGGIHGEVVYASTRPFDNPEVLLHVTWTPNIPNVTLNLYQEGTGPDGTSTLKLVDTTTSTSWDDWAQGFRSDGNPNMSCPGQVSTSPFFFTLAGTRMFVDQYKNNGGTALPNDSQFKCYDGLSNFDQVQPAPYDGMYHFPSVTARDTKTGLPAIAINADGTVAPGAGTNCTVCVKNPTGDGTPMLPAGKYVVEVVIPPGYELVKEEDKNILIGDNYIAPVTLQFPGIGAVFILPDQAEVGASYNAANPQFPTTTGGSVTFPRGEGDTGSVEEFWPCVGALRTVPDFISLFPRSNQSSPYAGAVRPLCDRKEVTVSNGASSLAKFYLFSSTHVAAKFTGIILDDLSAEFDPFAPQYGEKFAVPNVPISFQDYTGTEISRFYADQWGQFNGMTYSTWEVNPPNPTGYAPTMMVTCMNDPGKGAAPDTGYNPGYSTFCYEISFMPGTTEYMDTPVVPTQAFAQGYNTPDCAYPDATPAIRRVDSDSGIGPWVQSAFGGISSITVTKPGSGYNNTPNVIIGAPPAGGVQATAVAVLSGHSVASVTIMNSGSGYTSAPTVTFSQNHGATASAAVSTTGLLTITGLGDQQVNNNAYSGPQATTFPFNQKTITRHYGFGGTQGTGSVTIGGVNAPVTAWGDTSITVKVPGLPACDRQQFGASTAYCGQLVITSGNGKQSIDAVTVTVGGKSPTYLTAENAAKNALQTALDKAAPGDLIIVGPPAGVTAPITFPEMTFMWKPVRLQGVGATSVIIDANTHPSGKLDAWRQRVNCLFGLTMQGRPTNTPDPAATLINCTADMLGSVDRVPMEGVVGWDTTVNGNLAGALVEPTLMGAYEGAGITVLAKGVNTPQGPFATTNDLDINNPNNTYGLGNASAYPATTGLGRNTVTTAYLGAGDCTGKTLADGTHQWQSNFMCNPARIDGISVTNSSQGGGAIFAHGWTHFLEVSNNRVYSNAGTLSGGITIGQGEFADPNLVGGDVGAAVPPLPNDALPSVTAAGLDPQQTGVQLPYWINHDVHVHNNYVTQNASYGDELYSATPAGAGGVTFCTGADNYKFNYNWVCGNLSSGDGGGAEHLGFIYNGDMEHNQIIFNQSTNPTIPTYGGGLLIAGVGPDGQINGLECGTTTDVDCAPGLTEGAGPNTRVNANLIVGNSAESGSGGGVRLQVINGTEVQTFPRDPTEWYVVNLTNNIITNNVAGYDGGGVSMQDALKVNLVNNTIVSNDTTASAGVLFGAIGTSLSAIPAPGCDPNLNGTGVNGPGCPTVGSILPSNPQTAGVVTMAHTSNLSLAMAAATPTRQGVKVVCPLNHAGSEIGTPAPGSGPEGTRMQNGDCMTVSYPKLENNLIWQNRAFNITVGTPGTSPTAVCSGLLCQQNTVQLVPALTQTSTGNCPAGATYWDIGVRLDKSATDHRQVSVVGGATSPTLNPILNPQWSILTQTTGYASTNLAPTAPGVTSQACNGAHVPPENGGTGYDAPPGISDATTPNPLFQLGVAATVDEGNNWINLHYGPLSLFGPVNGPNGTKPLSDMTLIPGSPAINKVAGEGLEDAPTLDFYGTPRKTASNPTPDIGAVEFVPPNNPIVVVAPTSLAFGNVVVNSTSASQAVTLANTGGAAFTNITIAVPAPFTRVLGGAGDCGATLAAGANCTITVTFKPTATGAATGSIAITSTTIYAVTGAPVGLSGTGVAAVYSASLSPITLAFGNSPTGAASASQAVTVTNTGNSALTTLAFTFGGGTPQPYSRPAGNAGTCGTTLAVGASCTVNVVFNPGSAITFNRTLAAIAANGAAFTPASVSLSGTGVTPATVSITPNPLAISLAANVFTGTGTVTFKNTAAAGGASVTISNVAVNGGGLFSGYSFNAVNGQDGCTGTTLQPTQTCTVGVRFTNTFAARGSVRNGTITFTDTGANSPQVGALQGKAL
jgi:Bacterial Ig domain